MNPWKILGVHRRSTDEEIRLAFHLLAKQYHPDTQENAASLLFYKINAAYQVIKDAKRRRTFVEKLVGATDCVRCNGHGATARSKGLTGKIYTVCATCGGAGLIMKRGEESDDVIIELRGATGPGGKGRGKKR